MWRRIVALTFTVAAIGSCSAPPDVSVPSFADVRATYRTSDHLLLDRHGRILHERRVDLSGRRLEWTTLAAISPPLVEAVVTAEDRRFHRHRGVDWIALVRGAWQSLRGTGRRGGSTITMQVARLIDTDARPESTVVHRKWRQMQRAWAIERTWSKDEILEAYVNLFPVRGEIRGISAAATLLFGVAPNALTRAQAIVVAAGLPAPNSTSPWLLRRSAALATHLGYEDANAIEAAVALAVGRPRPAPPRPTLAPHVAARLLRPSGPQQIVTTIDATLQRRAIDSLEAHLRAMARDDVRDGAVLVVDNASGDILAYVGSSGARSAAPHVDGVRAARQAGSTLKPFLYGLALEDRLLTAASPLQDTPLELFIAVGAYRPTNYDDAYRGIVTLRTALAASLNIPAVRTLELVGQDRFLDLLHRFGFRTLKRTADFYGPGLALGVGEVTLWDLVGAYATLARGGTPIDLRLMRSDAIASAPKEPILSAETSFLINEILADREARSGSFGLDGVLTTPFRASVKTGTSTDMRDNWCIGYTQQHTVGVWVGNFSGAPMGDVSGVSGAAPIWADLMRGLQGDVASIAPQSPPAGLIRTAVLLPTGNIREEWFLDGTEPARGRVQLAPSTARIRAPIDGSIIAIDPGIPAAAQRIAFVSTLGAGGLAWWLDGDRFAAVSETVLWQPQVGEHVLELRDDDGHVLDRSRFRVRASGG